jgi:iron complex transport system permease protein
MDTNLISKKKAINKSQNYKFVIVGKLIVIAVLAFLVLGCYIVDLSTGAANLNIFDVITSLINPNSLSKKVNIIVRVMRLPIATMAILAGAGLAIAGMEMQTILNNNLASPYTLGISSAASFGASLSLIFGYVFLPKYMQDYATPIFAFGFSLISSFFIYTVGKIKKDRGTIILTGIAISFMFSALNSILTYFVPDEILRGITNWSQGSILGATWQQDTIVFIVLLVVTPLLFRESWKLTSLCMGESTAAALGIDVEKLRTKVLIFSAVITSIAVCFVGTIGFVGLVAPYVAKSLVGEEQRFFIPASMLTGAFMLSFSSVLSKVAIAGVQIPLGIITSIIGIPFLLVLILKKGR